MMTTQLVILQSLVDWFKRKTTSNAVRRVGGAHSLALSTDTGSARTENQDRCAVLRTKRKDGKALVVAVVCDGMGGMESGSDCASIAIASFLYHCANSTYSSTKFLLRDAVSKANDAVFSIYDGEGGTTLSALCVCDNGELLGVNVGDSRIYYFEGNGLTQISIDDTLVGQLGGDIKGFLNPNDLLQYVGVGGDIEPHILNLEVPKDKDVYPLITSDGVHFMDDNLITSIIKHATEPARAAQRLTELSKWCGGKDNASIVIAPSYDQFLAFRDSAKLGAIEIWDPFGELQLLYSVSQEPTKIASVNMVQPLVRDEKLSKPKKTRKKRSKASKPIGSTGSKKTVKKSKPELKAKEKPQLNIRFDSSQGE